MFRMARLGSASSRLKCYRCLSSVPRQEYWASLDDSQRAAWKVLGMNQEKWDNHSRSLTLKNWTSLSPDEKAAAKYGLGYTPDKWNAMIAKELENDHFDITVTDKEHTGLTTTAAPQSVQVQDTSTGSHKSMASTLARAAWNVAKAVAPTLSESIMTPPVVVNDIETTVYLDDSPSMNFNTGGWFSFTPSRLEQGRKVLSSLAPKLGSSPCRVLKFSNKPTVLSMREARKDGIKSSLPAITSGWDGSGNGTYLWKMVEQDVMERYRPGRGKLRLVVITDGEDNLSSPMNYQGMGGMDPMMRTLQQAGYDIEWHIVVIGGESGLKRYKALAGATGGSFLAIQNDYDENSRETASFLKAIESSTDEYERRERQRRYEKDRDAGKIERVDWYKQLPPPDKK